MATPGWNHSSQVKRTTPLSNSRGVSAIEYSLLLALLSMSALLSLSWVGFFTTRSIAVAALAMSGSVSVVTSTAGGQSTPNYTYAGGGTEGTIICPPTEPLCWPNGTLPNKKNKPWENF